MTPCRSKLNKLSSSGQILGYRINSKEHGLTGLVGRDSSTGGVCVGRAFRTLHQSTFAAGNKIIHRLLLRRPGATITG